MSCDVNTRRDLRVIAFVLVSAIILSSIGIVMSILSVLNMLSYEMFFPFSFIVDPPYLGIICAVLLGLLVTIALVIGRLRKKLCPDIELPFI